MHGNNAHHLRLRNWEWWSTTAPVWLKTSKRYLSPTGWWVISTAPSQTLGPPNMTLPSTKSIPCCWRLIMFQAKSTLQWVPSVSLPHSVLSEGPDDKTNSIWIKPERIKERAHCPTHNRLNGSTPHRPLSSHGMSALSLPGFSSLFLPNISDSGPECHPLSDIRGAALHWCGSHGVFYTHTLHKHSKVNLLSYQAHSIFQYALEF